MKKFLSLVFSLAAPVVAGAQAFSGQATSLSGKPLPNATVTVCSGWSDILIQNPQQSCNGQYPLTPPAAPGLAPLSGANPPAGTYKVLVTYVNALGQTLGSAPSSITTSGGSLVIQVTSPPAYSNATGWQVYFTTAGGSVFYQQSTVPIAIGSAYQQNVAINTGGANPPTTPTATNNILPLATIYANAELTVTLSNPFTTDSNGRYTFLTTAGGYTVTVSSTGTSSYSFLTTVPPFSVSGIGVHAQFFTSGGTFTIPAPNVKVTIVGGGGAGGGSTATINGGGGGSGSTAIKWFSGLTVGNTLTVAVGGGGTPVSGAGGNNGSSSSVSSGTQTILTITAPGGSGGAGNAATSNGGSGGTVPSNGDLSFSGNGGVLGTGGIGGTGGGSMFGGGGAGGTGGPGNSGGAVGAGGSGSGSGSTTAGGSGSNGIVVFEWVQ